MVSQQKLRGNLNPKRELWDDHVGPICIRLKELIGPELPSWSLYTWRQSFKPDRHLSAKPLFPDQMNFDLSRASTGDGEVLGGSKQLETGLFTLDLQPILVSGAASS